VRRDVVGRVGRRLGVERMCTGDLRKSWDVLATATFLEEHVANTQPVVDFGAYHSEIGGVLARLGYRNLHGVDLNRRVARGAYRDRIRYQVADFRATGYGAESLAAVTAISAIEHGHALDRLLAEVGRVLRPGGFFVASTDYWPEKVDTSGIRVFGMEWTVFSAAEMATLFDAARAYRLLPAGPVDYGAGEPVVRFAGRRYTFAWLVLRKEGDSP
jgi:SAM-dependent methyltransferase